MDGDPGDLREDAPADPYEVAREIALRKLTQRDCSRSELEKALAKKLVPDEVAQEVLDRLEEVGLVNDARFGAAWATSRHENRKLSSFAIARELNAKGLDRDTIQEAVAGIDRDSELETARSLAARKRRTLAGLPRATVQRRLGGLLARKGYGSSVVTQVVGEFLDDDEETADQD